MSDDSNFAPEVLNLLKSVEDERARKIAVELRNSELAEANTLIVETAKKEFQNVLEFLKEWARQIKEKSPGEDCRFESLVDTAGTFYFNFKSCGVKFRYFGPRDSGTLPGLVLTPSGSADVDFRFHQSADCWQSNTQKYGSRTLANLVLEKLGK
ncbi:MAG: hypothetical protein IAF58_19625 [Leptolyngbya sp.]|nr:hypothetical protein [Candidatus Melainabacteria bacterium]